MAIGILIGCILLALLSTAWAIYTHMQALCLTNRLENMLRRAEDGSFEESAFDESRLSKLETMLYHYLLRGATSQRVIQEEKDKIKSLISDISHQTKTPLGQHSAICRIAWGERRFAGRGGGFGESSAVSVRKAEFFGTGACENFTSGEWYYCTHPAYAEFYLRCWKNFIKYICQWRNKREFA